VASLIRLPPSQICALEPKITVRAKPHPTKKNRVRGRARVRVRLGNEKERGGSRAIAESFFFEPGICPCLSNRSEKVGIARPKRGSNLAIVPQSYSYSNSSSYSVPSLIFPIGIALSGRPCVLRGGRIVVEGEAPSDAGDSAWPLLPGSPRQIAHPQSASSG
jgi:hypothetical protein